MFFLTPNRNMFAEKFAVKSERFLAVLWEHIIFNFKWVEVDKMRVFLNETALQYKWSLLIVFVGFETSC